MIKAGVIGYGYWGPNLVRNLMHNPHTQVIAVSDRSPQSLQRAAAAWPGIKMTSSPAEVIADPAIDVIAIATPVDTHFDFALEAFRAGKHVWLEKPITSTGDQACRLIDEAERRNLVLLVDHTFVYTGAVRKMTDIISGEKFGQMRYYDSTRVNLGLFQHDVNVLWDLAVHDLSIMNHIIDAKPIGVSATGFGHVEGRPENVAFLTIFFDTLIAHINVNWLSPVKIRRTLVGGTQQMIVYDDLETTEKIKVYDRGIVVTETPDDLRKLLISYRTGDLWSPKLDETEALSVEVKHLVACIEGREQPITGGLAGLELVRILEAANQSLGRRGSPVDL